MSMQIFNPNETPAPCDTCPHEERCYREHIACQRFQRFTDCLHGGKREPNKEIYLQIFDKEKLAEIHEQQRKEKKNTARALRRRYLRELNARVMLRESIVQPEMFRKKGATA